MATNKQIEFYKSMISKSIDYSLQIAEIEGRAVPNMREGLDHHAGLAIENFLALSIMDASDRIQSRMKKLTELEMRVKFMQAEGEKTNKAVAQDKPMLAQGMYEMDGAIYKVQKAIYESGFMYAKKLTEVEEGKWKFVFAQGTIAKLTPQHRLTAEAAKEFGKVTGVCSVCGRTLTDETSIAEGIGPICKKRI